MPTYMFFPGIDGNVTEVDHKKWIECSSFQFGCGRSISGTAPGATMNREASLCSISEIVVTKPADEASQALLREATIGTVPGKTVKIEMTTTGQGNKPVVFQQYELENTMISGFSVSSGGDTPTESVSLNFTKISYSIKPRGEDASAGAAKRGYFDLSTGQGT